MFAARHPFWVEGDWELGMSRGSIAFAKVVLLLSVFFSKGALAAPTGSVSGVDAMGVVSGWALRDPYSEDAPDVDVHFYIDQTFPWAFVGQMTANLPSAAPQAQGPHGFNFAIPSRYFDGAQHLLYVYAVARSGN